MHWVAVILKAAGVSAAAAMAFVLANVDYSHTITLGSIVLGVIVVVVAGFFTVRSNVAKIWREEAEGQREKADRIEAELREKIGEFGELRKRHADEMAAFEKEQQEVRHALKDELAGIKMQLEAARARTDLGIVIDRMNALSEAAMTELTAARREGLSGIDSRLTKIDKRQEELVKSLLHGNKVLEDIRALLTSKEEK